MTAIFARGRYAFSAITHRFSAPGALRSQSSVRPFVSIARPCRMASQFCFPRKLSEGTPFVQCKVPIPASGRLQPSSEYVRWMASQVCSPDEDKRMEGLHFGFIGAGNMANAIFSGLVSSGLCPRDHICASDMFPTKDKLFLEEVDGKKGFFTHDNTEVAERADVLFLCVKPKDVQTIMPSIRDKLRKNTVIVSVIAGKATSVFEEGLACEANPHPKVVRAMPNTPMLTGEGACAIVGGNYTTPDDLAMVKTALSKIGMTEIVQRESDMDTITALSGSGPAYVCLFVEVLAQAAEEQGLDKDTALRLATRTVAGTGSMLETTMESPSNTRRKVTSPSGTTEAALRTMSEFGIRSILSKAVKRAAERSKELAVESTVAPQSTIVIKLGKSITRLENGRLPIARFALLVDAVHLLKGKGHRVIVVAGGAVDMGSELLDEPGYAQALERNPPDFQSRAAMGQARLIQVWSDLFRASHLTLAQVLVTAEQLKSKTYFERTSTALLDLLRAECTPFINGNDVLMDRSEDMTNNKLAGLISLMTGADYLFMISNSLESEGWPEDGSPESVNAALKKLSPHMREKLRAAQLASKGGARTLLLPTEGRSGVERCLNHILTTVGCAPLNDSMDLLVPGKIEFAPQKELSSGDQLDDTASNAAEDYLSQR